MDHILNWALRGIVWGLGLGAGLWILGWIRWAWRNAEERWPLHVAIGMLLLAIAYGVGHARLLAKREHIETGRMAYSRFGDPRRTELRRAEVRGWMLDCTGDPTRALATYREQDGVIARTYPIGDAGANLIGGGEDADERDFTIERLFASGLREPPTLLERGELHPVGTDLQFTLCSRATAQAWRFLQQSGRPGAVVVQDVRNGALVAYAATGTAEDAPFAIKRYAPPGSVFKLALAGVWWENGLPDDLTIPCPANIQVTDRARIQNFGGIGLGTVQGATGMLVPSCNTASVWMALHMRERLGEQVFVETYRRYGFEPYSETAPRDTSPEFWNTNSAAWARRMSPSPQRIRMHENTGRAEWAQLSIGQGPVDVTVIGISRFLQAIGNGGIRHRAAVEAEIARNPGEGERIMPAEVSVKLQQAMREVVVRGTGTAARPLVQGTGWGIGGKTGTAQIPGRQDDGWFAGLIYGPDNRAAYTVVVYLEAGGPGGRMPTIIAGQMARVMAEEAAAAAQAGERSTN